MDSSSVNNPDAYSDSAYAEIDSASQEDAILRRAATELAERKAELRALATLSSVHDNKDDSFETITKSLADPSATVRAAAVRALYAYDSDLATSFLNNVIRDSSPEERKNLGAALVDSGLINVPESGDTDARSFYAARSLLFLLAKAGEVRSLINVIRDHADLNLSLALVKTLALSKSPEVSSVLQQLLTDPSLPKETRSAAMEVVVQLVDDK